MENLQVYPMHECKRYIVECCNLINSEWPRSKLARYGRLTYLSVLHFQF